MKNDKDRDAQIANPKALEIRIGNVPLIQKIDALAAAVAAVREAHRDTISPKSWAAMNRAQEQLAEAMLHLNDERQPEIPAPIRRVQIK